VAAEKVIKKSSKNPQGKTSDGKAKTMAELMASIKDTSVGFKKEDKVKGKVVEITSKSLILDIGGKSLGLVAEKAFNEAKDFIRQLNVGDEVEGQVIVSETPDGYTVISLRNASKNFIWNKIDKLKKESKDVVVEVKNTSPSGLFVDFLGISGFIPMSHVGKKLSKNIGGLQGKSIKAKIIEIDRSLNRVILSEKQVSEAGELLAQKKALEMLKVGEYYKGKVTTITDFGVFVNIEVPQKKGAPISIEGLVHISEMNWGKTEKPSEVLRVGQKVDVKVLDIKNGRLSLSIKQAQEDPWDKVAKKYKVDQKIKGKIVKTSDFGVFVALEPGLEGLVHITKIPPGKRLEKGQDVNVIIDSIDRKEKKISLGLILTEKPMGYK
jgi:ribosomal protein S1